jgi:hypothetical protein
VRPDLLPYQFWRLATQDVHLHLDIGIETGPSPPRGSALNSGPPQRTS